MSFTTWVRVEDAFGQYDHPKGLDLPAGASLVENYPEYVGLLARASKAFTDKDGAPVSRGRQNYERKNKPALVAEVSKRIKAGRDLDVDPAKDTKADLIAALELDDAEQAAADTTSDTANGSDTGDHHITSGTDAAGSE